MCGKYVEPVTCAFNRCEYMIECNQHKKYGVKPCYKVAVDWKSVGNKYQVFEPKEVGYVNFLGIRITTRMLPPCTVCGVPMKESKMKSVAKCGHTFHRRCYERATSDGCCVQCKASRRTTSSGRTGWEITNTYSTSSHVYYISFCTAQPDLFYCGVNFVNYYTMYPIRSNLHFSMRARSNDNFLQCLFVCTE